MKKAMLHTKVPSSSANQSYATNGIFTLKPILCSNQAMTSLVANAST